MPLDIQQIIDNLIDVDGIEYDRKYSRVAKLHKYWSRKPWFVIDKYIQKYSTKNHVVLDPFCGSGIIGLQSVLAGRKFIGYDLNPFAVFLAKNSLDIKYNEPSFEKDLQKIEKVIKTKIMTLYKVDNKYILYTILGKKNTKDYNAIIADENFKNKEKVKLSKSKLESNFKFPKKLNYPDKDFPKKFYKDRFSYKGIHQVSDMFSKRNLLALALLYNSIQDLSLDNKKLLMLSFTNTLLHVSKLKAENVRPLSVNNFWVPDDFIEENVWWRFVERVKNVKMAKEVIAKKAFQNEIYKPISKIYNKSSLRMSEVKSSSVDYLITDPPYGDAIQYSELSYIWNCWLNKEFDIKKEVIINPAQDKGIREYYEQLVSFVGEAKRVLRNNAYFTLSFQNKDLKIWISLAELIRDNGMKLVDISSYNAFGSSYNKNWAKFSPKSDFYVTFKNQENQIKTFDKKAIHPNEVINEITHYLGKKHETLFSLNKAYDLFVGIVISKIFDGFEIANHKNLDIESIIELFRESIQNSNKEVAQSTLFNFEHI